MLASGYILQQGSHESNCYDTRHSMHLDDAYPMLPTNVIVPLVRKVHIRLRGLENVLVREFIGPGGQLRHPDTSESTTALALRVALRHQLQKQAEEILGLVNLDPLTSLYG